MVLAVALAIAAVLPSAAAAGSTGYTITTKLGAEGQVASLSRSGEAIYQLGPGGTPQSGYIVDYRRRLVTVLDLPGHRYQRLTLSQAVAFAKTQRNQLAHSGSPYVKLPASVNKPGRLKRLAMSRRIDGLRAQAWLYTRTPADVSRIWFSTSVPTPPPPVAKLLRALAAPGGPPPGNVPLLVEHRIGKRFHKITGVTRVRRGVKASAFRPPGGFKAGSLVPDGSAKASSIPAHLTTGTGYFPEESGQSVYAVYQGARFAGEPNTISRLDSALEHVITQRPYLNGLEASYGISPGRFTGGAVVTTNPDHTVGDYKNPLGYLNAFALVSNATTLRGAPQRWGRFDTNPPLIVIFVPEELVDGGGNSGYHSVAPVSSSLLDPFGLVYLQVLPFAIVKVPPPSTPGFIDIATKTLSHETVEAATDPVPTDGWNDGSKSMFKQQGEVADVCHEPSFAPFGDMTRVGGVVVSTYWDQALGVCFPESRPSVTIEYPPNGFTAYVGQQVMLRASATDPIDGPLAGISWTDGPPGAPGTLGRGTGTTMTARFETAGDHHLFAIAGDSQGLTGEAQVLVHVIEPTPTATITSPAEGSTHPSDETLNLHGSGHDPVDGALSGSSLKWYLDGSPTPVATGSSASLNITIEGPHTITLVATDSAHQASPPATVHITIGPPAGNPSIHILSPSATQFYVHAETEPVDFECEASDPTDGPLNGTAIQWYDEYTDVSNQHHRVHLGEGCYHFARPLYTAGESAEISHTITAEATDSLNHTSHDTVTIIAGAPG